MAKSLLVILVSVLFAFGPAGANGAAETLHPLAPPDTSSPRATLRSFMGIVNEAARIHVEGRGTRRSTVMAVERMIMNAGRCLDLTEIPPTAARQVALETVLLLFDVLHRIDVPPYEAIPDALAYRDEVRARWTIPYTEITIARVEDGPRAGQFLFSPETVARAKEFYEHVRDHPYRREIPVKDPYQVFIAGAGWMIPRSWIVGLPAWMKILVFEQTVWQWTMLALLLVLASAVIRFAHRWASHRPRDRSPRAYLRRLISPLSILLLILLVRYLAVEQIRLTGVVAEAFLFLVTAVFFLAAAWFIWLIAGFVAESTIASPRIQPESLDAHLVRMVARVCGLALVLVLLFQGAHKLGVPVAGLLTGLGVGGLALALAARPTIENFIGSLMLYSDRPVRVGDFCGYGDERGRVEEIGLRSTRIRGLNRTVTTIPNAQFSRMQIVNFTQRDRILLRTTLRLRMETTSEQLRFVLAKLRELLLAHPRITDKPARVRFVGFGDCSLDVEIFAYAQTRSRNEFLAIREDVFLRIMNIVTEAGTRFAFPSRTIYQTRDGGLVGDRVEAAEAEVRSWRSEGALPFPDFAEEYRQQVRNTLDYPPEGSPGKDGP